MKRMILVTIYLLLTTIYLGYRMTMSIFSEGLECVFTGPFLFLSIFIGLNISFLMVFIKRIIAYRRDPC